MRFTKIPLSLSLAFLMVFAAVPMCCLVSDVEASQDGVDAELQEKVNKAVQEALDRASANLDKAAAEPDFLDKLLAVAVKLPPTEQRPVLWQVLGRNRFIIDMRFITADRLLVNYTSDNPVLYDVVKGEVLWKFVPEGWSIGHYDIVAAFSDLVLIKAQPEKEQQVILAAIDPSNGKQLWYKTFDTKKRSFKILPIPASGAVLVAELMKKKVNLSAYDLFSGKPRWHEDYKVGKKGHPPAPIMTMGSALHFYGKTARFDPATGKILWERADLQMDNHSPVPHVENGFLYVVDQEKTLHRLTIDLGKSTLAVSLPADVRYTNIYPLGERIYLRGQRGEGEFLVTALDADSGRVLWTHSRSEPTVSNYIRDGDRLFVSTSSTVVCLDESTGREIFASPASQTGQTFPVRLRKFDNTLVYVGELVIAGFDATTGKRRYFDGMTPVSQEAHLDALDNWMSLLQERIGKLSKMMWFGGAGGAATAFLRQSEISQNQSNRYAKQAEYYRLRSRERYNVSAESDYWKSESNRLSAKIDGSFADIQAQLGIFFAMESLKNAMLGNAVAKDQSQYNQLQRTRKSIYSAYTGAESDSYAYRPHVEGEWLGVKVVHLPSGKSAFTPLCIMLEGDKAELNDRAIWQRIDFENRLIYHLTLRILPANYQADPPRQDGTVNYGMYLAATRIKMP